MRAERIRVRNRPAVRLTWTSVSDERPIVYYLYRSESPAFEPDSAHQIASNENILDTEWIDTDVEDDKTYYYKIIGIDLMTNDTSPVSNEAAAML